MNVAPSALEAIKRFHKFSRPRQSSSNGAGNPPAVRVRSSGAGEFEAAAEQSLYFGRVCFGMVVTNSLPGDIARDFMQIQGYGQAFFPGHDSVALDLLAKGSGRGHYVSNSADADF